MPIIGPGAVNVLIKSLPAARATDLCACIPPPVPDAIAFGSPVVLIGGLPAARMLDPTAKGGMILPPCAINVLIGVAPMPAAPTIAGMAVTIITMPDGTTATQIGQNMVITGSADFQAQTLADLATLGSQPNGAGLLQSINAGTNKVTIVETADGNECGGYTNPAGRFKNADGTNGAGTDATVSYNPHRHEIGDGSEEWTNRPPFIGLGHELVHANDAGKGQMDLGQTDGTNNRELQAVGLPPYENRDYTENKMREEHGLPPRPYY